MRKYMHGGKEERETKTEKERGKGRDTETIEYI
jgi:hypothetical protein